MTFEIHFELLNGDEDYVVISGEDIEELRQKAIVEVEKRNGKNPWSREIET